MKGRSTRFSFVLIAITRIAAALVLCSFIANAGAQNSHSSIKIEALDGRNGKPIKGTHLLVFAGGPVEEVRQHAQQFDLLTDQLGDAELTLNSDSLKFLQVWVDGMTICQSHPNSTSLSVEQVLTKGLLAPNECGKLRISPAPGQLFVFARPATLREKMKW